MEEILKKLDKMDKKLDELLGHPAEGTIKKSPFGDSIYKDGKWQAVPQPPPVAEIAEPEPAIPNTFFAIPDVPVAQAVYLMYLRLPDGREGWYGQRPRTEYVAEIRPVTEQEIAIAARCNRDIAGQLTIGPFLPFPSGAEVLRKVRNPFLPVPKGCKIINEWQLVPEV